MGFDINAWQKRYKKLLEENTELTEKVAGFEAEKARVVQDAVAAAVAPLRAELQAKTAALHHKERELAVAATEKGILVDRIACLEAEIGEANKEADALIADRDAWKAKYDGHQAEIEESDRKLKDAVDQLKRHEEKMSRRERERLSALQNRKVLAAAVPGRNRRA